MSKHTETAYQGTRSNDSQRHEPLLRTQRAESSRRDRTRRRTHCTLADEWASDRTVCTRRTRARSQEILNYRLFKTAVRGLGDSNGKVRAEETPLPKHKSRRWPLETRRGEEETTWCDGSRAHHSPGTPTIVERRPKKAGGVLRSASRPGIRTKRGHVLTRSLRVREERRLVKPRAWARQCCQHLGRECTVVRADGWMRRRKRRTPACACRSARSVAETEAQKTTGTRRARRRT